MQPPENIKKAFEELKSQYSSHIELKYLNKRFCIFEATSIWDPERKKPIKKTHYIGWITPNGIIVPAKPKQTEPRLRALEFEYKQALARKQELEEKKARQIEDFYESNIDESDKLILQALSMNPRMPFPKIAKISGLEPRNMEYRASRLEKLLGISYTVELNMNNLGFSEYMILAKFIGGKPSNEDITNAIKGNPRIQLALATKGTYDIIIFCVAENNNVIAEVLDSIRTNEKLSDIESEWYITPIAGSYGFIPLRQEFFSVLKEKVWHRKKHGEKPTKASLMEREYSLLYEMNQNSRIPFSRVEAMHSLPQGSAKRAFEDLSSEDEKNIMTRPTIIFHNLNHKYNAIVIAIISNDLKFIDSKNTHRNYIVNEPNGFLSKFSYICDMETPDGIFYLFPVFKDGYLETIETELNATIKGVKFESLIVEKVLLGSICYRKFDNLYSDQYLALVKSKRITTSQRLNYK